MNAISSGTKTAATATNSRKSSEGTSVANIDGDEMHYGGVIPV